MEYIQREETSSDWWYFLLQIAYSEVSRVMKRSWYLPSHRLWSVELKQVCDPKQSLDGTSSQLVMMVEALISFETFWCDGYHA